MILTGDCRDLLQTLPDNSIDCCITSPPYWGLRDYGMDGQIGLESTLEEYIDQLTQISSEIFRILKPTGTYWLNLGDKYVKSSPGGKGDPTIGQKPIPAKIPAPRKTDYPDKCLLLIPSRVAISLISSGWILRNEIVWAKSNPIPSSASDRCTSSHEKVFLLVKQPKGYHFDQDAIKEPASTNNRYPIRGSKGTMGNPMHGTRIKYGGNKYPGKISHNYSGNEFVPNGYRIKRDVWLISTAASDIRTETTEHYAKFPYDLVKPCILAGCPVGGTVLDPFSGSGTTGKVAHDLGREYIGIELNPAYAEASEKKIGAHLQKRLGVLE